jgi:hypothetical protein
MEEREGRALRAMAPGESLSVDTILRLFEAITGRAATPDEIEEVTLECHDLESGEIFLER